MIIVKHSNKASLTNIAWYSSALSDGNKRMLERKLPNLLKALKEAPIFGPRKGQPECVRVCLQDARGPVFI